MKLGEFIENFVERNCLIRLLYEEKGGHRLVLTDWNDVSMEWEVAKAKGKNRHYINNEVIGVTDILVISDKDNGFISHYSEAINIVIEELENQPLIEEVIDDIITNQQ